MQRINQILEALDKIRNIAVSSAHCKQPPSLIQGLNRTDNEQLNMHTQTTFSVELPLQPTF